MNINQMMKQAQELQKKLKKQQEDLAGKEYQASSGGGMVTATVNGKSELLSITLDPEVVNKEDVGMLQDLIVAAVNQAVNQAQEEQQGEMSSMMKGMGMNIPGLF